MIRIDAQHHALSVRPMAKKACFACLFCGGQGGRRTRFPGIIGDFGIIQRGQKVPPERIHHASRGFTLMESSTAIAALAILAGTLTPAIRNQLEDSRIARAKSDMRVLAAAVALQMKDTGCRPCSPNGPAGATGLNAAPWKSGGTTPVDLDIPAANTFSNLLSISAADPSARQLFSPGAPSTGEFSYKGPYLSMDAASQTDPWGNAYVLLGYNAEGQSLKNPIWMMSSGPDRRSESSNHGGKNHRLPIIWSSHGLSADDIALRLN